MTLLEIIARLEKATGPSIGLNKEILEALNPGCAWRPYRDGARKMWLFSKEDKILATDLSHIKPFTESLDAAVSLVPEGWCWEVRHGFGCKATVWHIEIDYDAGKDVPVGYSTGHPAIALCIAALRARLEGASDA